MPPTSIFSGRHSSGSLPLEPYSRNARSGLNSTRMPIANLPCLVLLGQMMQGAIVTAQIHPSLQSCEILSLLFFLLGGPLLLVRLVDSRFLSGEALLYLCPKHSLLTLNPEVCLVHL